VTSTFLLSTSGLILGLPLFLHCVNDAVCPRITHPLVPNATGLHVRYNRPELSFTVFIDCCQKVQYAADICAIVCSAVGFSMFCPGQGWMHQMLGSKGHSSRSRDFTCVGWVKCVEHCSFWPYWA